MLTVSKYFQKKNLQNIQIIMMNRNRNYRSPENKVTVTKKDKSLNRVPTSGSLFNNQGPKNNIQRFLQNFEPRFSNIRDQIVFNQVKEKLKNSSQNGNSENLMGQNLLDQNSLEMIEDVWTHQFNKKDIEGHLRSENQNLIQHRDFLLNQIRKYQHQIKNFKIIIKQQQRKTKDLEDQNAAYINCYSELKQSILQFFNNLKPNCLKKNKQTHLLTPTKNSNNQSTQQKISKISNYGLQKGLDLKIKFQESFIINEEFKTQNAKQLSKRSERQNSAFVIDNINQKFDSLMQEYTINKDPEIRKKCVQLAKQVKNLRYANKSDQQCLQKPGNHIQKIERQNKKNRYKVVKNPLNKSENVNREKNESKGNQKNSFYMKKILWPLTDR